MAYYPQTNIIIRLPERELQDIFNAMEIAKKGRGGFLKRIPIWRGSQRPKHLRVGARSTIWRYYVPHNNWRLAVAHTYLERGGTPVGEPDPKEIRIDEVILRPLSSGNAGGC